MSCPFKRKEEIYQFFDNIVDYINKANGDQYNYVFTDISSHCDDFSKAWETSFKKKALAKSVCQELIKLYKSLDDLKVKSTCSNDYSNECGFFNYWVNFKIDESRGNESDSIRTVYNGIESQFMTVERYGININFICNIKKDELDKMNILYRLYKIYTDLDNILENADDMVKKKLSSLSTACCTDYLEAKHMCSGGNDDDNNNSQFCKQLQKFETTYEGLYSRVDNKGPDYINNFKRLTQCNNNTVSTAVIGTTVGLVPLLVGLYKFIPLRQLINSNKGKLNQEYRNNDDKMRNIMLMGQESEHTSSQQGTYNIKYHSA